MTRLCIAFIAAMLALVAPSHAQNIGDEIRPYPRVGCSQMPDAIALSALPRDQAVARAKAINRKINPKLTTELSEPHCVYFEKNYTSKIEEKNDSDPTKTWLCVEAGEWPCVWILWSRIR